jgi:hypothetical protein
MTTLIPICSTYSEHNDASFDKIRNHFIGIYNYFNSKQDENFWRLTKDYLRLNLNNIVKFEITNLSSIQNNNGEIGQSISFEYKVDTSVYIECKNKIVKGEGNDELAEIEISPSLKIMQINSDFSDTNFATSGIVSEYPDAIIILAKHESGNFWNQGCHIGKIYQTFNTNDEALNISGHCLMGGLPILTREDLSGIELNFSWLLNNLTRIDEDFWEESKTELITVRNGFDIGAENTKKIRFTPSIVIVEENKMVGFTKYLRKANLARANFPGILTSTNSNSDQAWFYLVALKNESEEIVPSDFIFLWNSSTSLVEL